MFWGSIKPRYFFFSFRSFFLVTLGTHLFFFYKQEEMEQHAFYISQTRNQQTSNSLSFCGWSTKTTSQQRQKKCFIMFLHRHCSFSFPRFKFVNLETLFVCVSHNFFWEKKKWSFLHIFHFLFWSLFFFSFQKDKFGIPWTLNFFFSVFDARKIKFNSTGKKSKH